MPKREMTRRDCLKLFLAVPVVGIVNPACLTSPDLMEERYPLEYLLDGEIKELPIEVIYPRNYEAPLPVVAFSHGIISSPDSYSDILKEIARAGYFVVAPQHNDLVNFSSDGRLITLENLPRFFDNAVSSLESVREIERYREFSFVDFFNLIHNEMWAGNIEDEAVMEIVNSLFEYRMTEFSRCLDSIEELSSGISNVDYGNVGVAGHSLGGIAVLEKIFERNPAIKSGLFFSPATFIFREETLIPTRWITGTEDWLYRLTLDSYVRASSPSSFVSLVGVRHTTFNDSNCIPDEEESCEGEEGMKEGIVSASTSFLVCCGGWPNFLTFIIRAAGSDESNSLWKHLRMDARFLRSFKSPT